MSMLEAEKLLLEFNTWYSSEQKARQRYQAQLAPEFSLLDYLRRDEMALSEYLAMLLNPQGPHGQGDLYLQRFLQLPDVQKLASLLDFSAAVEVDTEYCLPNGRRMDVYLHSASCGLGIEDKPWAVDQANQLRDYAEYLHGRFPGGQWLLIYLCNSEISEYSLPADTPPHLQERVVWLDFFQLAEWLAACAPHTRALPVKVFVEALGRFVNEKINGETMMDSRDELTGLVLRTEANTRSAFLIAQQMREVKQHLLEDFIKYLHQKLADLKVAEIWLDPSLAGGAKHAGFHIQFHADDSYCLRWAFDRKDHGALYCGICILDSAVGKKGEKQRNQEIHRAMNNLFKFEGKFTDTYPWWTHDFRIGMGASFPGDWGMDPEAWLMLRDRDESGFAAGVVRMARQLYESELNLR